MKSIFILALVIFAARFGHAQSSPTASLQKGCVDALVDNGYDLSSGAFIDSCRGVVNVYSVRAVKKIADSKAEIDIDTMNALVRVNGPLTFGCVAAFLDNEYPLNSAFAETCLSNRSTFSLEAIQLITHSRQEIDVDTLSTLAQFNSFFPDACVGTMVANGYEVNSAFAEACSRFSSETATRALQSIARTKRAIDIDEMDSLSRLGL